MTKSVIVTGSDSSFFELAQGLVTSIRKNQPEAQDIVVLDCGLEDLQREWLAKMDVRTVEPGWDITVEGMGEWFKACVARPHLPKWVPGYDCYLWLDSDTWIQDWAAIDMLLDAANKFGVAAVPTVDRAYPMTTGQVPGQHTMLDGTWEYQLLRGLFAKELADRRAQYPTINSGVFAARADSSVWRHWSRRMRAALERAQKTDRDASETEEEERNNSGNGDAVLQPVFRLNEHGLTFLTDQTSFNVALYEDVKHFARLPAWCNWLCHRAFPILSETGEFLEGGYPFRQIGILHMTAQTKNGVFALNLEGGGTTVTSLRCPWVEELIPSKRPPADVQGGSQRITQSTSAPRGAHLSGTEEKSMRKGWKPGDPVRLETPNYLIRSLTIEDVSDRFVSWFADPDLMVPIGLSASREPGRSALEFVEKADNARRFVLGIFDKAEGAIIGFRAVDFVRSHSHAKLDSILDPAYQGRRIGYELHDVFYDFLFYSLGVHKVVATIHADNVRSRKMTERIGYQLEVLLRDDVLSNTGEWSDLAIYGLLESDWRARKKPVQPAKQAPMLIAQWEEDGRLSRFQVPNALAKRR